jgi:hypothetical protein
MTVTVSLPAKKSFITIVFLCTYTLVLLCAAALPCLAGQLPAPVIPSGFGVNIHFTGEPKDLDLIAEAGFKFIRMDFSWSGIEREKGVYNFQSTGYDALTEACIKRGISMLYILDYSNRLYESEQSVRTPEGRLAFAAFAEAAAKRYAGKNILWEIWNEPNIKQFWQPQPGVDDYCKLVEAASPKIKQGDPNALVVAPATSTIPFDWLEACFKKGLLNWIDALTVHPYRPQNPETVINDYIKLRELITRYAPKGKTIPIISGEWGYSNVNWDNSRLSDVQQAQYLARMFLINLRQNVPVSIWYDWKNDGPDPNEREHNFGTMTRDLKPKSAYLAAKTLSTTLAGFSFVRCLYLDPDKDFGCLLKKDNIEALALWTTDKEHEMTLPMKAGEGTLIDMFGSKTELSWADKLKITVTQSPQYLLFKAK